MTSRQNQIVNKLKKIILSALFVAFLGLSGSWWFVNSDYQKSESANPVKVSNIPWLKRYVSLENDPSEWHDDPFIFDENGIVQFDYGGSIGTQYNPATIAQYALANYNFFLKTGQLDYKDQFLKQAEYLIHNFDEKGQDSIGYPYHFDYSSYELKSPWYSALAQGQIISVLTRVFYMQGDARALAIIRGTKNFLVTPTDQGGLLTHTPEGYVWLEEFPTEQPSLVLNGFVFAIFGLYDYLNIFPDDQKTKDLYNECLISLKESMQFYDTGSWVKYQRFPYGDLVTKHYMKFQILQNLQLYLMTGDPYFAELYRKWDFYFSNKIYP